MVLHQKTGTSVNSKIGGILLLPLKSGTKRKSSRNVELAKKRNMTLKLLASSAYFARLGSGDR